MEKRKIYDKSKEYSGHASWAIWGKTVSDLSVFNSESRPEEKINTKYVFVGLNASNQVAEFNNFHFDSKMKNNRRAFDNRFKNALEKTSFEGSYLTDLVVKGNDYNPVSSKVKITEDDYNSFLEEISFLGNDVIVIALGNKVYDFLSKRIKCYKMRHFSCRGSDKNYYEIVEKQLGEIYIATK